MEIERAIEVLKEYNNCKAVLTEELEDATDIAIQALEMQIPKKPNTDDCCPDCGTYLKDDNGVEGLYCPNCGQKIDWGDE